jgi:DNA methylase
LPLFKKGSAPHLNNVKLGKKGRWRSNVWTYPGASSRGSDARRGLQDHPTVKPTAMLEDALLDMTNRGDIVLDPFLGSGSTLIAAAAKGRICRGVELDPLYVDVIIRRYQAVSGKAAILAETGETFAALAARRAEEGAIQDGPSTDTAEEVLIDFSFEGSVITFGAIDEALRVAQTSGAASPADALSQICLSFLDAGMLEKRLEKVGLDEVQELWADRFPGFALLATPKLGLGSMAAP